MNRWSNQHRREVCRAYGDPLRSREAHEHRMEDFNLDIRENSALRNRSLVLSALAGLISAAGVIGDVYCIAPRDGGSHACAVFAKQMLIRVLAGGVAVGYTTCCALVFERVVYDIELSRELWEIDNHLTGEIQEMVAIYRAQGFSEDDALVITRVFAKHKVAFANLMMVEELGYSRLEPPSGREALVDAAIPAAIGYAAGCLLPLLPLALPCLHRGALHHRSNSNMNMNSSYLVAVLGGGTAHVLAVCTLATAGIAVSVAQSEVFYGGYTSTRKALKVVLWNLTAAGAVYTLSRVVTCLVHRNG
ncbi:Ccc1 family [Trypanosoma melophagium]|uniref:Ccc1 family n=1 Tax=Trypanosoma melophagium TaxID=715481 RepID=UPI003519DA0A|nr:Ccc1 family [Trypanosoma melophagium]